MLNKFIVANFLLFTFCVAQLWSMDSNKIFSTKLDNGLEIIVIENATVPLATIEIDVRNGAFTEPPEYDGLSHLFEHMFFKANASIPNQERFLERTRELGINFNATTSEERVNFSFTVLKDSLEASLKFMKAAITSPLFLEEELVNERPVVIDEFDRNESNPTFHLIQAVNKKLWYKYFSRKNTIGDRDIILTADGDKMRTIQRKYYIPNNSALLVAGDVNHTEVFALAKEYFSDWEKGKQPFPDDPYDEDAIPYHPSLEKIETVIVEQDVNAVTIMLSWQGPSVSIHPYQTYAADVFSFIMNQNSKFPRVLSSSGLFTGVSFSYATLNQKGPITIVATTTVDKFPYAKRALFEELKFINDPEYFTDDQIEYAKTNLEVRFKYLWESPSAYVQTVGFWWSVAGLEYFQDYMENIKKVDREDINVFIKKYIQDKPYVLGILVSPEDRKKLEL